MTYEQKIRNEDIKVRWGCHGEIEIWRVFALADMAERDEAPDRSFSDAECAIWCLFHRELHDKVKYPNT